MSVALAKWSSQSIGLNINEMISLGVVTEKIEISALAHRQMTSSEIGIA